MALIGTSIILALKDSWEAQQADDFGSRRELYNIYKSYEKEPNQPFQYSKDKRRYHALREYLNKDQLRMQDGREGRKVDGVGTQLLISGQDTNSTRRSKHSEKPN